MRRSEKTRMKRTPVCGVAVVFRARCITSRAAAAAYSELLQGACLAANLELVQALVEKGASLQQRSEESGRTPLHFALCAWEAAAEPEAVAALVEWIMEQEAGAETVRWKSACGRSALHYAARVPLPSATLQALAVLCDVDDRDKVLW